MDFKLETDIQPKQPMPEPNKHSKKNWPSPEADQFLLAFDYLDNLKMYGSYSGYFDSKKKVISPNIADCKGLSKNEIQQVTDKLNSL